MNRISNKKNVNQGDRRHKRPKNRLSRLYLIGDTFKIHKRGGQVVEFTLAKVDGGNRIRFRAYPEVKIEQWRNGKPV